MKINKLKICTFLFVLFFLSCKERNLKKTFYKNGKIKSKFLEENGKLIYYKSFHNNGEVYKFFNEKINDTLYIYNKDGLIAGKKKIEVNNDAISLIYHEKSNENEYVEIIKKSLKFGKNWVKLKYHTKFPEINTINNMKFINIVVENCYNNNEYKLDTFGFDEKHYRNGIFNVGFGVNICNRNIKEKKVKIKIIKKFYYSKKPDSLNVLGEWSSLTLEEKFYIKN